VFKHGWSGTCEDRKRVGVSNTKRKRVCEFLKRGRKRQGLIPISKKRLIGLLLLLGEKAERLWKRGGQKKKSLTDKAGNSQSPKRKGGQSGRRRRLAWEMGKGRGANSSSSAGK